MPWRVRTVQALPDWKLRVVFVDGTVGDVDLSGLLSQPEVTGTLFEPIRDREVFAQVRVEFGAVQWPNGADLAPDAMYDAIREHGRWVID